MKSIRAALALAGLAALAACDIPTEAPILEQRWILPVENTTISVTEFLPSGVTAAGDLFSVSVAPASAQASLVALCTACAALVGQTGPMPAFQGDIDVSQALPGKVSAAVVSGGTVTVAVRSDFNFDPLAGGGTLTVTLQDGPSGRPLGEAVITGSLAPGSTATRTITLAPGAVGSSLLARARLVSTGGQTTTITGLQKLVVTATPSPIQVSSATVNVANEPIALTAVDVDVEDIDEEMAKRVESGAILLDIANPFGVSMATTVEISFPGGKISKSLNVASNATSTATLQYSGDELRRFLGKPGVRLGGAGNVSSSAGAITVTPTQRATIGAKIDLTLKIGG